MVGDQKSFSGVVECFVTPRKGHHRWVESAKERSSALQGGGPSRDALRESLAHTPRLCQGEKTWKEESSLAHSHGFLRSEELGFLRSRLLAGSTAVHRSSASKHDDMPAMELRLVRAEYEELRAMHLVSPCKAVAK
jgi:hypothetical protein